MGCDLPIEVASLCRHEFQSTHPRGVRLSGAVKSPGAFLGFNPRTRVGCDCGCWCGPTASSRFNPRTRVGCDLPALAPFSFIVRFQSTHPRGVRRAAPMLTSCAVGVSIHAPAWGATPAHTVLIIGYEVSIHAPAWGATQTQMNGLRTSKGFQSTHPRGVRLFPFIPKEAGRDVSIHAPAWGATGPSLQQSAILQSFNPRTRVGCDGLPLIGCGNYGWFQSTHPRGVRQVVIDDHLQAQGFNPRTRVGCDHIPPVNRESIIWFQSTHPRGVRRCAIFADDPATGVSIHAPAWGATR